ncbi:winged helix-turn-helix transcriptional regulator [Chryseobacterium chendengshani]|uniref:winged helix-turn-helix transcriptional regulator n=1 Tax=unclassified Chryseobacterium TaxID=2593645 RepID=UPI001C64047D|nr:MULTISPECIES: helix-turn-helix domain-containing protein [unclassified Chryseobacterium]MBW7674063.1 helix-turn-helix transcriptional regulator [Chryseobacterium sp. LJ756]MBW8522995.1 helix-turn-helix transcriptional regulator [Chryseobacterium sp. LJ668]QYK16524.1 helix-turn-helix transcriptional regulator [Chryseobacterium sp. LJ668]
MPDFISDKHLFHNPVEFAMSKIGGMYKMPILWRLKDKTWRYSELAHHIPHISDRMLSKSLKELLNDGFISKKIFPEVPLRTEYTITERGNKAIIIITALRNYGFELMNDFGIKEK